MNPKSAMQRAIQLSEQALGWTDPNPAVGAVIFDENGIWSEGWTQAPGQAHAEIMALQGLDDDQRNRLSDASMAVTLEPCSHHGLTPPCADALISSGIRTVYVAIEDPNPKVSGSGIDKMRNAGIKVELGLEENLARWVNRRFLTSITKQRPYIVLKWAESPDGFIDRIRNAQEMPSAITGRAMKSLVHWWRHRESAVLVGHNTYMKDRPKLTVREVEGRQPSRIVISDEDLKASNWEVWSISRDALLKELPQWVGMSEHRSILVEGGAKIHQAFIELGLWDEIRVLKGGKALQSGIVAPEVPKSAVHKKHLDFHKESIDIYTHESH